MPVVKHRAYNGEDQIMTGHRVHAVCDDSIPCERVGPFSVFLVIAFLVTIACYLWASYRWGYWIPLRIRWSSPGSWLLWGAKGHFAERSAYFRNERGLPSAICLLNSAPSLQRRRAELLKQRFEIGSSQKRAYYLERQRLLKCKELEKKKNSVTLDHWWSPSNRCNLHKLLSGTWSFGFLIQHVTTSFLWYLESLQSYCSAF